MQQPAPHTLQISSSHSDVRLQAELLGQPPWSRAVLVCHPHPAFGGQMDVPLVRGLWQALAGPGRAALRFNFRGVGASTGQGTGGRQEHHDVLAALAWLEQETGATPHLVGYSFGAAMSLAALSSGGSAASACCVGFPTVTVDHRPEVVENLRQLSHQGPPQLHLAGDQDPFCDPAWLRQTLDGPAASVEELQGQGHFFEGEALDQITTRAKRFVDKLTANS